VSGGAAGIALIILGVGLLLVAQIRAERQRLGGVVDLMGKAVARSGIPVPASANGQALGATPLSGEPFLFQVKNARILALVFCIVGFAGIVLGWNGMAKTANADEQLPYIVSGGVGGVALVLFGVAILFLAQIRTERAKLMIVLELMATAISRFGESPSPLSAAPGTSSQMTARPASGVIVVAGPSTYHREDCRLIEGKAGLDRVTLDVAEASGLSPCRVCKPRELLPAGEGAEERTSAGGQESQTGKGEESRS
jgi:hypothetical protein